MTKSNTTGYARAVNAIVSLGSATYGYYITVISENFAQPGWYAFFDLVESKDAPGYEYTTHVQATCNGLIYAGGAVGTLFCTYACEKWGRKGALRIGSIIAILGGALQAGAVDLKMFFGGRFCGGCGIGILLGVVPLFLSELSKPDRRGFNVGHQAFIEGFGTTLPAWIGVGTYFASKSQPSFAWRFPLAFQVVFPTILFLLSSWVPESPRWLLKRGQQERAWRILQRLHGKNDSFVEEEFYQMSEQLKLEEQERKLSGNILKTCFFRKSYRKRMLIGFLMGFGTQMIGISFISNYTTILFSGLGVSPLLSLVLLGIFVTLALFLNLFGSWLHDKVNSRRIMFMIGACGCIVTTSILAALTAVYQGSTNDIGLGFGIAMIYLYLVFFAPFNNTTMYIYPSEIFPYSIRTIGVGFSFCGLYCGAVVMTQTAPIAIAHIGWKFYLLIIIWTTSFMIVVYFFFPETANLSLEEIGAQFGDQVAVKLTDAAGANEESRRNLYEFIQRMADTEQVGDEKNKVTTGENTNPEIRPSCKSKIR